MNRFHRGARAVDTYQVTFAIEDENTIRHGVECCFPFSLAPGNHLEELGLGNTNCQSFFKCFNQAKFILGPVSNPIRLMNAQHTAKLSFNDQRVINLRTHSQLLGMFANINRQILGRINKVQGVVND